MYVTPPLASIAPTLTIDGEVVSCGLSDLRRIVFLMLEGVPFSEEFYLSAYPDVRVAIANGNVASAFDHYRRSGYLEGRMPLEPPVDETWYRDTYPEVAQAIERGDVTSARAHFIQSGWQEGRQPCEPTLDPNWYARTYPHAQRRMDQTGEQTVEGDFLRHGYQEGLRPFRVGR